MDSIKVYIEKDMRSMSTLIHVVRDTGKGVQVLRLGEDSPFGERGHWYTPDPGECANPTLRIDGFPEIINWSKDWGRSGAAGDQALDAVKHHLEDMRKIVFSMVQPILFHEGGKQA